MLERVRRLWAAYLEGWLKFWGIQTPQDEEDRGTDEEPDDDS